MTTSRAVTRAAILSALAALLTACGASSADEPAAGTEPPPHVGTIAAGDDPTSPPQSPGYDNLVVDQPRQPASRFTPCNLVTRSEAQAIVEVPLLDPVERPQGPTCIYRGKAGSTYMTIAVAQMSFESVRPRISQRRRLKIDGRTAYCGTDGREMLYVSLPAGRVLSISAPCDVARRLALKAVPRLAS